MASLDQLQNCDNQGEALQRKSSYIEDICSLVEQKFHNFQSVTDSATPGC